MKRKILTRIFCMLFSLALMLSAVVFCPSAEDHYELQAKDSINQYLVAHYDFEGDTLEEQLSDKAPTNSRNKNEDTLSSAKSSDDALSIEKGVATVKPDASTSLYIPQDMAGSFDGRVIAPSTIYMKFKFTGTNTGHAHIMEVPGMFRIYRQNDGFIKVQFYNNSIYKTADGSTTTNSYTISNSKKIEENTDIYFAVSTWFTEDTTTTEDKNDGTLNCRLFLSTDGVNYTYYDNAFEGMTQRFGGGRGYNADETRNKTGKSICIGNHSTNADNGLDFEFDDIRFYQGKSLNLAEVKQISAAPTVIGCQNTPVNNGETSQDIRFISLLSSASYSSVGYNIKISYTDNGQLVERAAEVEVTEVYKSLLANADGSIQKIDASTYGGEYFLTLTIKEVPIDKGEITFVITPYATDAVNTYSGKTITVVYNNGVYQQATA